MNYSDMRPNRIEIRENDLYVGGGNKVRPVSIAELNFSEVLGKAIEQSGDIKFSAHSLRRLYSRGIRLNDKEMFALLDAVTKADKKNSKNSLIIGDRAGFIVNIPNRTVVTAVDTTSLKDNIFTNIDTAVIV